MRGSSVNVLNNVIAIQQHLWIEIAGETRAPRQRYFQLFFGIRFFDLLHLFSMGGYPPAFAAAWLMSLTDKHVDQNRGERPADRPSGAACAKRPHGRLRRLSAELENVGEAFDFLERRAHGRVPAAFWKNPENILLKLGKFRKILAKIAKFWGKKQQNSKTLRP